MLAGRGVGLGVGRGVGLGVGRGVAFGLGETTGAIVEVAGGTDGMVGVTTTAGSGDGVGAGVATITAWGDITGPNV